VMLPKYTKSPLCVLFAHDDRTDGMGMDG